MSGRRGPSVASKRARASAVTAIGPSATTVARWSGSVSGSRVTRAASPSASSAIRARCSAPPPEINVSRRSASPGSPAAYSSSASGRTTHRQASPDGVTRSAAGSATAAEAAADPASATDTRRSMPPRFHPGPAMPGRTAKILSVGQRELQVRHAAQVEPGPPGCADQPQQHRVAAGAAGDHARARWRRRGPRPPSPPGRSRRTVHVRRSRRPRTAPAARRPARCRPPVVRSPSMSALTVGSEAFGADAFAAGGRPRPAGRPPPRRNRSARTRSRPGPNSAGQPASASRTASSRPGGRAEPGGASRVYT